MGGTLKSNMDRFIAGDNEEYANMLDTLKSNMDRFIAEFLDDDTGKIVSFKIQYG